MRCLAGLALLLVLLPRLAAAQVWPSLDRPSAIERTGPHDVAVLVAVQDYLFVPPVPGARQNVAEWEVFLRDGLGVMSVTTLANEQATREEVLAAADAAVALAGEDSTVWFLFVGHGAPAASGADGLLLGVDSQQTTRSLAARGIGLAELLTRFEAGPQKRTVLVLDACFSGRTPDGAALVPDAQPVIPVQPRALAANTVLLTAAAANEYAGSLPGLDRPAFSYLVLGALRGWADDGDGRVTAQEAVSFAGRELLVVPGRRQTPSVAGNRDEVLSTGAYETRPQSVTARAEVVADPPITTARPRTGEPEPNSRLRAAIGLGAAAELTYETATPLVEGLFGLRLSHPRNSTRFTLIAGLGYASATNVVARETEAALNQALRDARSDARLDIDVATTTHLLTLGAGPGLEIGRGAVRFFGDFRGGLALPLGGECVGWDVVEDETVRCNDREPRTSPMWGARLGVAYRMFEVAAQARFTPRKYTVPEQSTDGSFANVEKSQTLFVAGMTFGVGFDL